MRRVLFLDFDGVVHPAPTGGGPAVHTVHFGWLPVLLALLEDYPDVEVVVHSTWRFAFNLEELQSILEQLGPRVVDVAPKGARYDSILRWLHLNPDVGDYRILDDDPSEFPKPPPAELIVCDPTTGLTGAGIREALESWLREGPVDHGQP